MEIESDSRKLGIGRTVLVVDDNAAMRKILAGAFLSDGFKTCVEAENGREGIAAAKTMPVMNGLEAAAELRKIFPTTPIILFTLYGDTVLKTEASRAGVNAVLLKTVPLSTLINKAHELLGR